MDTATFVSTFDLARELGLSKGQMQGFIRRGDLHVLSPGHGCSPLVPPAEADAFRLFIRSVTVNGPDPSRKRGSYCQDAPSGRCVCRCHAMRRFHDHRSAPAPNWRAWKPPHDDALKALVAEGLHPDAIAERLNTQFDPIVRTRHAVTLRIRKLGLSIRDGWWSGEDLIDLLGCYRRRIEQWEAQGLLARADYGRWRRYRIADVEALVRTQAGATIDPRRVRDPRLKALAETSAAVNRRRQTAQTREGATA